MDKKELGKPQMLDNVQVMRSNWSRLVDNFVKGVLGEPFRVVIKCAAETESEFKNNDIEEMFSENADRLDSIEDVRYKNRQWFMALMALTEEEPQDIVKGGEADNGAVAWR